MITCLFGGIQNVMLPDDAREGRPAEEAVLTTYFQTLIFVAFWFIKNNKR
jgi:hypothetical protein